MNGAIVVYSYTGNTAACATALQQQLEADAFLLVEEKEREGKKELFRGGMQAVFGMRAKIKKQPDVRETDVLILGMPLWAGTTPPAVNSFLHGAKVKRGVQVYAFVTQQSKERPAKLEKQLRKRIANLGGQFQQLFWLTVPAGKSLCVEEALTHTADWANQMMADMSV